MLKWREHPVYDNPRIMWLIFLGIVLLFLVATDAAPKEWQARVVCADQSMAIEYNPEEEMDAVELTCATEHEQEHIDFIADMWPFVCLSKDDGEVIHIDSRLIPVTECMAYAASFSCFIRHGQVNRAVEIFRFAEDKYGCELSRALYSMKKYRNSRARGILPKIFTDTGILYYPVTKGD